MNKVVLMGRLTNEPDIRYSQGEEQMCIARYTLAVDRRKRDDGADFIRCVAFRRQAEFAEKYLHKGTKIAVSGHIQTGSYDGQNGKVYTTDVVVDESEFAESKNASESAQNGREQASRGSQGNYANDGFMSIPDGVEDEGLPFN